MTERDYSDYEDLPEPEKTDPFLDGELDELDDLEDEGLEGVDFDDEDEGDKAFAQAAEADLKTAAEALPATSLARPQAKAPARRNGHTVRRKAPAAARASKLPRLPAVTVPAALSDHYVLITALAETAQAVDSSAQAGHLAAAMVPLAAELVSHYRAALWPCLPVLIEGTVEVTRLLHRHAPSRPYISLLPAILAHTVTRLAQEVAVGRVPTATRAADILADHTGRLLEQQYRATRSRRPGGTRRAPQYQG